MRKRKIDDTKNNICFKLRNRETTKTTGTIGTDKINFLQLIEPVINKKNEINFNNFLSYQDYENKNILSKIKNSIFNNNQFIYYLTDELDNKIILIKINNIIETANEENNADNDIYETETEYYVTGSNSIPVKIKYELISGCDYNIMVKDVDLLNSLYTDGKNYYYIPTYIAINEENKIKLINFFKSVSLQNIDYIFKIISDDDSYQRQIEQRRGGGKNNKNKQKIRVIYTDIDNKGKKYKYINYKKERYIITNKDIKKQYIIINKIRINIINKQK